MPSPVAIQDSFGVWYQLGEVSVGTRLWRQAQYPAISPVLRLSVPGIASPLIFNSFVYVRMRYRDIAHTGQRVIERATRYYPDADATIIRLDPAFASDRRQDWNLAGNLQAWIELMGVPSYRGATVPAYSVKIEELG